MQEIEGLELRFRSRGLIHTATIWIDDVQVCELATLDLRHVESPEDPFYVAWQKAIGDIFLEHIRRTCAESGVKVPDISGVYRRPASPSRDAGKFDA